MKKIFLLLACFILLVSTSGFIFVRGKPPVAAGDTCDSATYFCSDFEDEADDGQWGTPGGTWNDDYTTSPAPLEGSESCLWGSGAQNRSVAWSGSDGDIYMSGIIYFDVSNDADIEWNLEDSANGDMGGIEFSDNADLTSWSPVYRYNSNASTYEDSGINPAEGDTWCWQIKYNNGSGSNGVWEWWLVEDTGAGCPAWGSSRHSVSNATDTAQIVKMNPRDRSVSAQQVIIDDIRVHDSSMAY